MPPRWLLFILCPVVATLNGPLAAQVPVEAQDYAGQTVEGQLVWSASERRWWIQTDSGDRQPLEKYRQVQLRQSPSREPSTAPDFELQLWGAERLSVRLERLVDGMLHASFAGGPLEVPLAAVAWVTHYSELAPVWDVDFDDPGSRPKLEGNARIVPGAGQDRSAAVVLEHRGDRVSWAVEPAVADGVVRLLYRDPGPHEHRFAYMVELKFRRGARFVPLQLLLLPGAEVLALALPEGPAAAVEPIERQAGWHRFVLRMDEDGILATVDDAVLTVLRQPLGELVEISIVVPDHAGRSVRDVDVRTHTAFVADDLEVRARRRSPLQRQPAPGQDEVMLYGGSQYYGQLTHLDRHSVRLQTDYQPLRFPWSEVHRVYLAPRPLPAPRLSGQRAWVIFRPARGLADRRFDNLEGILAELREDTVVLLHPFLGRLSIPLDLVGFIAPGRHAHWMIIDASFHHLGDEVVPEMQRPYPEGTELQWTFELDAVPAQVWLVMDVVNMEPMVEGARYYKELSEGHLRTVVELNGQEVDFVNRHLELRRRRQPQRVRIELPARLLRQGKNVLRLRQFPQGDNPSSYDDCGISGISLEWPIEAAHQP